MCRLEVASAGGCGILNKMKRRLTGGIFAAFVTASSAAGQTYITPATAGWAFATETPTGSGVFVTGPGTPPLGSPGSIQLTVGNPGGELFATQQFAGTLLSRITGLRYDTYVVSSSIPEAAVGAQWELPPVLAHTDERFHRRSRAERAHVGHSSARRRSL